MFRIKSRVPLLFTIQLSLLFSSSCLEPSGDRGSAIGKGTKPATEGATTDDPTEVVAFADFSAKLITNCSSAGCHAAGGVPPVLLVEDDMFLPVDATIPDKLAGPVSLETMKGVGSSMPPGASTMQVLDADFVAQFESWLLTKFDETGAPLPAEDAATTTP